MRRRGIDYSKFLRFILIVVFAIVLIFAIVSSCMNLRGRALKIGLSQSNLPLTHVDDKKSITGFEAEYARLLAEKLGKKAEIKIVAPEDMAAALDGGAIDCVVSARQSVHDYIAESFETKPFISYGLVFVKAKADDTMEGEEDLDGKRIGLIINSDAEQLCNELKEKYNYDILIRLYDFEIQPFQELKLKKNDVVIADELFARYMQIEDPDSFVVLDTVYSLAKYGLRLSKKLTRQAALDIEDAVISLKSEVAMMDLFTRWFGVDLS